MKSNKKKRIDRKELKVFFVILHDDKLSIQFTDLKAA